MSFYKYQLISENIKKYLAIFFLVILGVGVFPVSTQAAHRAEECADLGVKLCIQITSISPAQPEFGKDFSATARLRGERFEPNQSFQLTIFWLANPSRWAVTDPDGIVAEGTRSFAADQEGKFEASITQSLTSAGFTQSGTNRLVFQSEYILTTGNIIRAYTEEFTFSIPAASPNARVEITAKPTSEVSGLTYEFEALYFPPNSTTPVQDGSLTVSWNFGDNRVAEGYKVQHKYAGAGTYTVKAVVKNADGDTLAPASKPITISGNPAQREGGLELTGVFLSLVNGILGIIFAFFRWIAWILSTVIFLPLLEATLSYTADEIAGGVILAGWTYVRDVVNMFFILFLIIIGLATMLRIESYNYRKLLATLIIMALLVNFSLVIGRIIIEIFDTAQFTFLPIEDQSGGGTDGLSGVRYIYHSLTTAHISNLIDGFRSFALTGSGALAVTFSLVFQTLLEVGVALTFGALAIFMLIRTVALWILLILSPLAYALLVLPATSGIARSWWSNFLKYALFAPLIAFFIRLTLVLYEKGLGILPKKIQQNLGIDASNPQSVVDFLSNTTPDFNTALGLGMIYVVILAFLWAGLIVTRQMGIYGANGIINIAQRGLAAPLGAVWGGTKLGAGVLDKYLARGATEGGKTRRVFSYLSPLAWREAWKKRQEEQEKRVRPAIGARADALYKMIRRPTKWGKPVSTSFGLEAHQSEVLRRAKERMDLNLSEREMAEMFLHAENPYDKQGLALATSVMRRDDDTMRILREKMKNGELEKLDMKQSWKDPLTGREQSLKEILKKGEYTPEDFQNILYGSLLGDMQEQEKVKVATMIQEMSEKTFRLEGLSDTIELEDVDGKMKRKVNYGYQGLEEELIRNEEKLEAAKKKNADQLTAEERMLLQIERYYNAVEAQYRSRIERMPANRTMNATRAASFNRQFLDDEAAETAQLSGEAYNTRLHATGRMVARHLGYTHATQLANRLHELQVRGVIPVGVKGEEIAPDDISTERAAGFALADPSFMKSFLDTAKRGELPAETKLKIFNEANRLLETGEVLLSKRQRADFQHVYESVRREAAGGAASAGAAAVSTPPPATGRNITQQISNEVIRGEAGIPAEQHQQVREVIREVHSGTAGIEDARGRLESQGIDPATVERVLARVRAGTAEHKVRSTDPQVFASVPGINPDVIRDAVRQGVEEGFVQGARLGSRQMADAIKERIKQAGPRVTNINARAEEISNEINKVEQG